MQDGDGRIHVNLRMIGFSSRNGSLADFLSKLSSDALFEDVLLKYARETRASSSSSRGDPEEMIQFQIECRVSRANGG